MRTKIVATVGPATASAEKIRTLVDQGVDVIRINFAHATHEGAADVVRWTREVSKQLDKPLAVLADLAGPKIRIGALANPIQLEDGQLVVPPKPGLSPDPDATA